MLFCTRGCFPSHGWLPATRPSHLAWMLSPMPVIVPNFHIRSLALHDRKFHTSRYIFIMDHHLAVFLVNMLHFAQFVGIFWALLGGERLFRMVGFRKSLPSLYWTIRDNQVPIAIFIYCIAPFLIPSGRAGWMDSGTALILLAPGRGFGMF